MKECSKCGQLKSIDNFSLNRGKPRSYCKECHNKYVKEVWYPKNSKKQIQYSEKWKKKNPEKTFLHGYSFLQNKNQITEKPLNCEICGKHSNLQLDHCHSSNKFRGWICNHCNLGLGHFFDNIFSLESAIKYLKKQNREAAISSSS